MEARRRDQGAEAAEEGVDGDRRQQRTEGGRVVGEAVEEEDQRALTGAEAAKVDIAGADVEGGHWR